MSYTQLRPNYEMIHRYLIPFWVTNRATDQLYRNCSSLGVQMFMPRLQQSSDRFSNMVSYRFTRNDETFEYTVAAYKGNTITPKMMTGLLLWAKKTFGTPRIKLPG